MTLPDELDAGPVLLRRWRSDDAARVVAAIASSHAELRPWMPWAQEVPTLEAEREILAIGADGFDRGEEWGYGVFEAGTDEVVGACGLHRRLGPGAIEIGYWLRTDRWGRGYATAAAGAATTAAFEHLPDVSRVEIHMDRANERSVAVPRRLGFELVGEEARERIAPGHTGVTLLWRTTREAWRRTRAR